MQLIILIGNDFNSNSELQITIRKKNMMEYTLSKKGGRNTCFFPSPLVTLCHWIFSFQHICIISFCSALICRWNCLSCRIRLNVSSSMRFECCLRMHIMLQIIWHAALISSHHAMRCCHHSVSIARSRLQIRKWKSNGGIIGSKAKSCCNGV